ncbi:UDP-glucuronic acid decarboxylase family protein [Agrococcus citreus]|uniref:UDP-glucuronate decarboxylase n=1 Tax=Agrococcus citreus TaxID=84643 RepID=A0ABN1YRJ7_9MICO
MKRILVTGGAGFIGSHLIQDLLANGDAVVCLDNLFSGRRENIEPFLNHDSFSFMERDVCDPIPLMQIDQIYHLACPASPPHYQFDPIKTRKTNFHGTLNVLELSRATGARLLFASTSEVYGDPEVHPQPESYRGNVSITGIRSCYDVGKMDAEGLCFDFMRQHGIDHRVIRIFNTYGPNMREDDGRVVSNFIAQALKGRDLTIYGDGSQTRSFQFVSDLVRGMKIAMAKDDFTGPVNIGNPGEFTIKELAEKVLEAIPSSISRVVFMPLPADDPAQRKPDISQAMSVLGWRPTVQLDEGLRRTIAYFEEALVEQDDFSLRSSSTSQAAAA